MPSFKTRSYQKELLDRNDIPFADIRHNMEELDLINKNLGGHKITIGGLKQLLNDQDKGKPLHIVEIGCGGGDNLRALLDWANTRQYSILTTGIDINKDCIAFAEYHPDNKQIGFVHSDYRKVKFEKKPDIIFSSLFCHHFTDEELIDMVKWMRSNSSKGFFINDLHRHPVAYYSILLLTKIFSKSYLVKNDAPLSVRRGFIKKDWETIFNKAGIYFQCKWKWAFRWLVWHRNHD